jgi:hypothetical protein
VAWTSPIAIYLPFARRDPVAKPLLDDLLVAVENGESGATNVVVQLWGHELRWRSTQPSLYSFGGKDEADFVRPGRDNVGASEIVLWHSRGRATAQVLRRVAGDVLSLGNKDIWLAKRRSNRSGETSSRAERLSSLCIETRGHERGARLDKRKERAEVTRIKNRKKIGRTGTGRTMPDRSDAIAGQDVRQSLLYHSLDCALM